MRSTRPIHCPESLEEIFLSRRYRQDFRNFLVKHDAVAPLLFLEAVKCMMRLGNGSEKEMAHARKIHRKFFGKETNYGRKLFCDDKTIHLIAEAKAVSPSFLSAAYIPVKKSMEKIWFRKYIGTFQNKYPTVPESEIPPMETETQKPIRRSSMRGQWVENITQSQRIVKKLFHFIILMRTTTLHEQMIDYVRILCEEDNEQVKAILEPRSKGGKSDMDRFEETIPDVKRDDLPNLERRILFLHDMIQYKTLYNSLQQYGGVHKEKPFLVKKARLMINKYLNLEDKAHLLLGVPRRLTVDATMSFRREGISTTLFHELNLCLMPIVFKIWKTMQAEYKKCVGGKIGFGNIIKQKQTQFSKEEAMHLFKNVKKEKIIRANDQNTRYITLNFSLQEGIRIYLPKSSPGKDKINRADNG